MGSVEVSRDFVLGRALFPWRSFEKEKRERRPIPSCSPASAALPLLHFAGGSLPPRRYLGQGEAEEELMCETRQRLAVTGSGPCNLPRMRLVVSHTFAAPGVLGAAC